MVKLIGRFGFVPASKDRAVRARPKTDAAPHHPPLCAGPACLFWLLAAAMFLPGKALPAMGPRQEKDKVAEPPRNDKPTTERREVGKFTSKGEILIRRSKEEWKRIPVDGTVFTGEPLVSLPGYKSRVDLNSGVRLLLWGSVP